MTRKKKEMIESKRDWEVGSDCAAGRGDCTRIAPWPLANERGSLNPWHEVTRLGDGALRHLACLPGK